MTATRANRKRKGVELTLSAEALDALRELAPAGRRSEYVEGLILDVRARLRRRGLVLPVLDESDPPATTERIPRTMLQKEPSELASILAAHRRSVGGPPKIGT